MTKPAIRVEDVTVRFRPFVDRRPTLRKRLSFQQARQVEELVALDRVSFDIAPGEAFGVIGRNGAGKSTLMRVIAKTLRPNEGRVVVNGVTSTLLQLGVGFNLELSGARNVYLGGLAAGMSKQEIDERFDEIIDYAELRAAMNRPLKTYSSGMFSRLAFAVGMSTDPDILLLDEVFAVGDEAFQQKSFATVQGVLERTGTVVLVSHSMRRILEFCDRVLWLDNGRVVEVGPAEEVCRNYTDAATANQKVSRIEGWPAARKLEVVLEVLGGLSVEKAAAFHQVRQDWIDLWVKSFLAAGKKGLRADALAAFQRD